MSEINTFIYNDKGKPEADKGKHDDLVFATGLALIGIDQADDFEEEIQREYTPRSKRDILEWEMQTGKLFTQNKDKFWDSNNAAWTDQDTVSPLSK
jgi:hypothetical protein